MTLQLERTLIAIGRLDATLRDYPLLSAWWYRAQLEAAVRLIELEGAKVDAERLLGSLAGITLPLRDGGTEARALRVLRQLQSGHPATGVIRSEAGDTEGESQVEAALHAIARGRSASGILTGGLKGLRAWLQEGGSRVYGHLALARHMAQLHLVRAPWPCLLGAPRGPVQLDDGDRWVDAVLRGLEEEALRGADRALDLRLAWRGWRRAIGTRRRGSNFPRLLDLASALPMLTPKLVSEQLACTIVGASKLLAELRRAKILAEVSGRGSWKCYVTRDLEGVRQFSRAERLNARAALWPEPADDVAELREQERELVLRRPLQPGPLVTRPSEQDEAAVDLGGLIADLNRKTAAVAKRLEVTSNRKRCRDATF
jgi:hypothetical protein